jgi:hypothetical protein
MKKIIKWAHNLYYPSFIIRMIQSRMRWEGNVVSMGDEKFTQCLENKSEGKRLSQQKRNWKVNNDRKYTKQKEAKVQDEITQDMFHWHALLNMLMNFSITSSTELLEQLSDYRLLKQSKSVFQLSSSPLAPTTNTVWINNSGLTFIT